MWVYGDRRLVGGVTACTVFICCSGGADPNSITYPRIIVLDMVQDKTIFITLHYYMGIWVSILLGWGINCAVFSGWGH